MTEQPSEQRDSAAAARPLLNIGEDWAATITGLALLALALLGAIPAGLVP